MRMADSLGSVGALPVAAIAAALGALCQSSLVASTALSDERTSCSCGFGSGLVMPNGASDGPAARISTCCGPLPCTMRPAIITLLPVSTRPRVAMLMSGTSGWSISNTPTTETPVPPSEPCTIAVYAPGANVTTRPASSGSVGAKPCAARIEWLGSVCQSSLVAITALSEERTSVSDGLASGLLMPNGTSEGPVAVIATVLGVEPPMMRPAIITLLPVSTFNRVGMLKRRGGLVVDTTENVTVACAAGACVASPAWLPAIVHVPRATPVTTLPEIVHTLVVRLESVTGRPELALAVMFVVLPRPSEPTGLMVMTFGPDTAPLTFVTG